MISSPKNNGISTPPPLLDAITTTAVAVDDIIDPYAARDPLPPTVRPHDHVLLHFADGRQLFAQAMPSRSRVSNNEDDDVVVDGRRGDAKSSHPPCKINKRTYATDVLIGLSYGTVLEVNRDALVPLLDGNDTDLIPDFDDADLSLLRRGGNDDDDDDDENCVDDDIRGRDGDVRIVDASSSSTTTTTTMMMGGDGNVAPDNRDLIDDNTSQLLSYEGVRRLMEEPSVTGAHLVAALISNSSTYVAKTPYSRAKYVRRKQLKYQPRCRIVRITPWTLCAAMHLRDLRKMSNLREDTLGQVLSNANVSAGRRVMVMDGACLGIITAGCVRRMAGYGTVISLYEGLGMHPGYYEGVIERLNLTLLEKQSLRWVNQAEVFCDRDAKRRQVISLLDPNTGYANDVEKRDRDRISWPAPLQPHTRAYAMNALVDERKVNDFLLGRSARFARKLTRHTALELRALVDGCRDGAEDYDCPHDACDYGSAEEKEGRGGAKYDGVGGGGEEKIETSNYHADEMTYASAGGADDGPRGEGGRNGGVGGRDDAPPPPRQCDSLIIASKYDPTATLFRLLPYLAPSCPFVVYHEFLEPLLHTFHALQNYHVPTTPSEGEGGDDDDDIVRENGKINGDIADDDDDDNEKSTTDDATRLRRKKKTTTTTPMMLRRNIAINLRLTDTWFREYQVLDGRTHPNMTMSQNGGYLLTGTKLCPLTGTNELDEEEMREMRAKLGGRRRQLNRLRKKNGTAAGVGSKRKAGGGNERTDDEGKRRR
ncbi:hypothetical protein ACHAXA_011681 [Cyclostephanos tholiformis]|uniref:tRNA (adenine(58)-N(1))-methyltransferase non-catalytic subunit TRM6 n=1 Tax=Cyclostephanos tholiformis TaxID=382380 RepID=A0ABD3SEI5_9STRA